MKIQYIGHSCFLLQSAGGTRIVTDPFGEIGFPMPKIGADAVTLSHAHYDHCNVSAIAGNPLRICEAGAGTVGDVAFEAVKSYHDDVQGRKRGENLIFRFSIDGFAVCHCGDLGEPLSDGILQKIGRPNILLLPVGGNYTIDARTAFRYVSAISPSVTIPMHYRTARLNIDIDGPKEFLALCERAGYACSHSGGELDFGSNEHRESGKRIILMERI